MVKGTDLLVAALENEGVTQISGVPGDSKIELVVTLHEKTARANSLPWAFQAAVFARDYGTAMRSYRALNASAVVLKDHSAFRVDWMPFAGLGPSGLGVGGISYTFHDMQVEKLFVGPMQ